MYKVFLVDDEIVIREGIRNNFPWDDTPFFLVGEAPDGEIALSMLQDVKPDILITDIRMPFMDGMKLCEAVNRTMPWIQTIILSGYDDFAYAKQAISLGVREYLLKPVSAQEILGVLQRIAQRIEEERRQQADLMRIKRQFASNSRFLKEKLLTEALSGVKSEASVERMVERARGLNFSLVAARYLVMLACLRGSGESMAFAQSALYRLAGGSGDTVHVCETPNGYALVVLGDSDRDLDERAYSFAQSAIYEIERSGDARAQIFIGEDVQTLTELSKSYHTAQLVRHALSGEPENTNEKRRIMGVNDVGLPRADELIRLDVLPLSERLKYVNLQDVDRVLGEYVNAMGSAAIHSMMMVNFLYVEIMMAASRIVREAGGEPREVIEEHFWEQSLFSAANEPEELMNVAGTVLKRAIAFRDARSTTRYNETINKARAYLAQEYRNSGITLNDVARHVCMSNSHFCTIFSQELGITFTEYLTNLRINRAKELLRTSKLRSSDIAYAVGYNDPHYFSYLFKKNVGLTPRDYRREAEESAQK